MNQNKSIIFGIIFFLSLCFITLFKLTSSKFNSVTQFHFRKFGTYVQIIAELQTKQSKIQVKSSLLKSMQKFENIFSSYQENSELSKLNHNAFQHAFPMSKDLNFVVQEAFKYRKLSDGVFEPTIRELSTLWNPLTTDEFPEPSPERRSQIIKKIQNNSIKIQDNRIRFLNSSIQLDLDGIAKGYIVDAMAKQLQQLEAQNICVDIGGDIRVLGHNPNTGKPWRIGIASPRKNMPSWFSKLHIITKNTSIATSGDYHRKRIANGKRIHHIMDPKSGAPATKSISATVIAETAMKADALATTMFIMGPQQGAMWLHRNEPTTQALWITKNLKTSSFHVFVTQKFSFSLPKHSFKNIPTSVINLFEIIMTN